MKQKTIIIISLTALSILLFAAGVWFGQAGTFGYGQEQASWMMNGRSGMMMNNGYMGMMAGNMHGRGMMYAQSDMMEMMHNYHDNDNMLAMMASMPDHEDTCPYHDQFFESEPDNSE